MVLIPTMFGLALTWGTWVTKEVYAMKAFTGGEKRYTALDAKAEHLEIQRELLEITQRMIDNHERGCPLHYAKPNE